MQLTSDVAMKMDEANQHHPVNEDAVSSSSSSSDEENEDIDKSQTNTSTTNNNINEEESKDTEKEFANAIIAREEKHVRRVRYALAMAIIVCAAIVSGCVYKLLHRSEYRSFEQEFAIFTESVISNVQWEKNYNFALLQQLSSHVTSSAVNEKAIFPNHTVPQFEIEAGYANGLSGMIACAYIPFVSDKDRAQWEEYTANHHGWVNESVHLRETYQKHLNPIQHTKDDENERETIFQGGGDLQTVLAGKQEISSSIYHMVNGSISPLEKHLSKMYAPLWQITPPVPMAINADLFSSHVFEGLYSSLLIKDQSVISPPAAVDPLFDFLFDEKHHAKKMEPHSFIAEPVHTSFDDHTIVGMVIGLVPFHNLLDFLFSERTKGVICVFTDGCGTTLSYEINGAASIFLGYDDFHYSAYDSYMQSANLIFNETADCALVFSVYPSHTLESAYITNKPFVYASIVVLSFVLTSVMIILYDRTVTMRQEKTMRSALQNGALIASLFPAIVRDRLLEDTRLNMEAKNSKKKEDGGDILNNGYKSRPIADFFPNTTLMFADIAGFTAWSSTREPFQVFELLETIYGAFDELAKRRRIFKVETVGDCYVAVCGISEARADHAIAMAKFARDCLSKMRNLTKMLEVKLGPDTSSLSFRVGLHSGPVTGGVLRGDNARFQLFGDTVNTAARMESTGIINRVHMSHTTATLLMEASKGHWVQPRDEIVYAKGKGDMKTYWLVIDDDQKSSRRSNSSRNSEMTDSSVDQFVGMNCLGLDEKTQRLANWNAEVLLRFLKLIIAKRSKNYDIDLKEDAWDGVVDANVAVVDEVAEIITLPTFSKVAGADNVSVTLPEEIELQLCEYVTEIAKMYQKNPFHNFEHASHVTMSVVKLMGRIVRNDSVDRMFSSSTNKVVTALDNENIDALALHDHTYGITSDPLTQFACIFAALIHDVDHYGVTNAQLINEMAPIAVQFDGKSVLEQNSVVLAWNLLLNDRFRDLRNTLCATRTEVQRFRQLVVNAVMATDIMAPDLKLIRNGRWNTAFASNPQVEDPRDTINRKATIVIDHIIQASDVCHTMQHWHIYRKWNEQLFIEMTKAFKDGRAATNPADTWYQGEIGFFDYYIIPLAKKLADCGVFGVASDEYLIYAKKNREEWVARGEEVVLEMKERMNEIK